MRSLLATIAALTFCFLGAKAAAIDLIREGKAVSTIVLSDQATKAEQQAAEKLVKYLAMASGAELPVVKESAKPGSGTLISLGRTTMAKRAGVTGERLKYDGYRLGVKAGTLYLLGRDTDLLVGQQENPVMAGAQGSLRAVFGLLDRLGFRWLQPTPTGTYVPEIRTVSVPDDLNVTYEPPLMYMHGRMNNWGDWSLANSYRTAVKNFTRGGHTWGAAIPGALFKEHPECFLMVKGQRRLDANNPQYCSSSPLAQQRVADWTMRILKQGYEIVQLGQQDGFRPCECELCSKLSPGDQVHDAHRKIIDAIREKYPDRQVQLLIYYPTVTPPTHFESYPANTVAELCLTGSLREAFGSHDKAIAHWQKAAPGGITIYSYYMGMYFDDGYTPRFHPELAAAKIKSWIEHGVKGIYWCGGGEKWGTEGPTYYVLGRLATDPKRDWRQPYEEYINLTFRKAAPAMKQYYDALYKQLARFRDPNNDSMLVGTGKDGQLLGYEHGRSCAMWTAVYPEPRLVELQGYLDKAKRQAGHDQKAQGWIRLAQISYDQYALIARIFHEYQKFRGEGPKPKSRDVLRKRAQAYYRWVDETVELNHTDPEFKRDYFPDSCAVEGAIWSNKERLKTNFSRMPPVWFE